MDPERWPRVREVLQGALELEPGSRAAFLDRACPDPEDRREVESLIASHDRDASFLEDGAGAVAAQLFAPAAVVLSPGDIVGSYRIERETGRGGMGVVYLARDIRLDRPVALKVLRDALSHDARRRERLRREARAAAAVSHPGVAQVHALEENADGHSFLVSEFVDGRTLREEIGDGGLSPALAIDTASQVAHALAAAHRRGVTHRDLKPENVMRTGDGSIKVLDFGLARLEQDAGETRLTRPGLLMGTPGYIAPEQLLGDEATAASDIYALGLLLHEMLTGRHAFAGSHATPTTLMARVLEGTPNALPPEIAARHPGLEALVRRCLAKRPEDRFSSMAAVAAALDDLSRVSGRPVSSPGEPLSQKGGTGWWQLHQVVISVLFIAMIYPTWLNRGGPLPRLAHTAVFLTVILAAALAATLRLHLVFTARVHPSQRRAARARARRWTSVADGLMTVALLTAGAAAVLRDRVWFAALFFTVAASTTVAALLIEPATTEATFGAEER